MKLILSDPPEGFMAEAEYRQPKVGEQYLYTSGNIETAPYSYTNSKFIVLTRKERRFLTFTDVELPQGFSRVEAIEIYVDNNKGDSELLSVPFKIITKDHDCRF